MNFTYVLYQLTLVPFILFFLWVTKERVLKDEPTFLKYLFVLVIVLGLWGELAIYLKQWFYPLGQNLGIYLGNHPIELYIEAIITPLFILSIWEFIKRKR